jgi:DNA polymerase I
MTLVLLDEFLPEKNNQLESEEQITPSKNSTFTVNASQTHKEKNIIINYHTPLNLPASFFISAKYDGQKRKILIKLYEPITQKIYFWIDTRGHKPYCLTNIPKEELKKISLLIHHPGFDYLESVKKYDALHDQEIEVTKIVAKDPLSIGGRPVGTIRDIIPNEYPKVFGEGKNPKVWESAIKYYQCYINDEKLSPGMVYKIKEGELVPVIYREAEESIKKILETYFEDEPKDFLPYLESWIRLLEYPAPYMKRAALDIEVFSPIATRVPDAETAPYPVICASIVGSDGKKIVLLLKREGTKREEKSINFPPETTIKSYKSEKALFSALFDALNSYPFIVTFNGDDFDLRYLFHRAQNEGFKRNEIPIESGRRVYLLKHGIHLDLYRFFFNRSIQIYAFAQKYRNITLNEISQALLGKSKLDLSKPISELSDMELARYCLNDSELTLDLTTFNDEIVMKLMIVLTRISRMPMEDVTRQGVSRWIRSFMQYEHRKKDMLIPNKDDIITTKGKTATKSIIKGKKYKGAIVVQPIPGVHFNVSVMDFQSLYPSIMKVHNLGYQSVRCQHMDCKKNRVPGTPHWICTKNRALESALIGSLRDLRVKWYKPKAKDKTLSKTQRNWYEVTQRALKVILNASYGVFGADSFDLYCPPVAEATAALGRDVITQTINRAQELGIQVIYGDTDSIFLKNPSLEKINILSKWSDSKLGMELEVEKHYRYAVLSSRKKNYLGIFDDGSVDVKGLTGKKRHIPKLIKKSFDEMETRLSQVKTPADFDVAKKDIEKIIYECYNTIKKREWDNLEEMAFEVVLGKPPRAYIKTTPQHVKAARQLKDKGVEINAGDLIRYVKVLGEPQVKPVQLAFKREIDTDKYIAYLRSTFDQILDALGLEFDKIIGLTKLEQFM